MKTDILYIYDNIFLRSMRNVADKVAHKIETRVFCSVTFFEIPPVYEIIWKGTVELDRPQVTIWRIRIACWIAKATNAHSDCVMVIALPRQKGLRERARVRPSKMKHNHLRSSPYRAVNTLRLGYKYQSVSAV